MQIQTGVLSFLVVSTASKILPKEDWGPPVAKTFLTPLRKSLPNQSFIPSPPKVNYSLLNKDLQMVTQHKLPAPQNF